MEDKRSASIEIIGTLLMLGSFAGLIAALAALGGWVAALLPALGAGLLVGYRMATGTSPPPNGTTETPPTSGRYSEQFDPEDPDAFLPR